MFEKYLNRLNLGKLLKKAKEEGCYSIYEFIVSHDKTLDDPNDFINLFPLYKDILYVAANMPEKISDPIPFEHFDVLIHRAPRGSKVADHLLKKQLDYIGKRTEYIFNGEACNYFSGSLKCREHIEKEILPVIHSVYPYLRHLELMECDLLEKYLITFVGLLQSGWTEEQFNLIVNCLGNYKLI